MIRRVGLLLVGCALCVTPVAADEDVYDGPTAIKPLTVAPQPQQTAAPNVVCDFEHQCYPEKGGPMVPAPVAPPVAAAKPIAPQGPAADATADDPVVTMWRDCMGRALQNYERSHNLHALQVTTVGCQMRLEQEAGDDFAGTEPPLASPSHNGRRNLGCGWWPIGSDADRDCAAGGRRF